MTNNFHSLFILVFVAFIVLVYMENKMGDVTYVQSSVDGKDYLVRNLDDKNKAANMLAKVKSKLERLVEHLSSKYRNREDVQRLVSKFDPNKINETKQGERYTSYTVNKSAMNLCLRHKNKGEDLIDPNTVAFVALHELAHIMTKSVGHTEEFWKNFKFLLKNAVNLGIYDHVDYSTDPQPYCGITVSDTPLTNDNI